MYKPRYEYRATKCHDGFVFFHFLSVITKWTQDEQWRARNINATRCRVF